jgi:gluconate kinase
MKLLVIFTILVLEVQQGFCGGDIFHPPSSPRRFQGGAPMNDFQWDSW